MKTVGWLLLLVGVIVGIYALSMEVTVAGFGEDRVNNIGLMSDRQNYLIIAGILSVIGAIILITQKSKEGEPQPSLSDRDKLKKLLNQYQLWRRENLDPTTLKRMESINERRKKLGLTTKGDSDPEKVIGYVEPTAGNIIRLLDKIESKNSQPSSANLIGVAEELMKLKSLLDGGVITQSEFEDQKRRLLQ
jgi:hypothetical protein